MSGRSLRWLLLILALAAAARFYELDTIPPGITTDEALNGVFAQSVLAGDRPMVFEPDSREPLYLYAAALSVAVFGPTPLALRIPIACVGVLLVLAMYLLGRRLFDPTAGVLAAASLAAGYWPLQLSREGFRALTVPLVETLAVICLWQGLTGRRLPWLAAAGALAALSWYTYPSARLAPVLIVLILVLVALTDRARLPSPSGLAVLALAAAVIIAPLTAYYLAHPDSFAGRLSSASATGAVNPLALLGALRDNLLPTLGMFSFQGDSQWKYNLSGQPVFGAAWSLLMLGGLLLCVRRWRQPAYAILPIWLAIGLLPGALSGESPHFMRTVGAMPAAYLLPVVALLALGDRLRAHVAPVPVVALAATFFAATGAMTAWQYFGLWANSQRVAYYFYADMNAVASYINTAPADTSLVISAEYYDLHRTMLRYLSGDRAMSATWIDARRSLVFPAGAAGEAVYLFPASAAPPASVVARLLPGAALLTSVVSPQGFPLMAAYSVRNAAPSPPDFALSANFGHAVRLVGYDLEPLPVQAGHPVRLTLHWHALTSAPRDLASSYRFSVQLVDQGGYLWAQDDGLGYPGPEWHAGDTVATYATLIPPPDAPPGRYLFKVGLYSPGEPRPVSLLDAAGAPAGTQVATAAFDLVHPPPTASAPQPPIALSAPPVDGLRLRGFGLGRASLGPGERLRVILYWRAETSQPPDRTLRLQLAASDGTVVAVWSGPLAAGYPAASWSAPDDVRSWYDLPIPAAAPAGVYTLSAALAGQPSAWKLGEVRVAGRPRQFVAPPIQYPAPARVGDFARLLGYSLRAESARPGGAVGLTLYWQALATPPETYTVFVHLLDTQSRLWGQVDSPPLAGAAPTTSWLEGEVLADAYSVPVKADAPPGDYALEIGMYDPRTNVRLSTTSADVPQSDHLILGRIRIEP